MVAKGDMPGEMAPNESTAACLYDKQGPKLGVDTSDNANLFRALAAVVAKVDAGAAVVANDTGRGTRGCAVIAEALTADSSSGVKMRDALLRRGLLEKVVEPIPGKGTKTRSVLKPTAAGRVFVKERQEAEGSLTRVAAEEAVTNGGAPSGEATAGMIETPAEGPLLSGLGEVNF
jgi:hypothetical protein